MCVCESERDRLCMVMGRKTPVDEIVENNTLYWLFSWCVTSVGVYVNHGRSTEVGYFRSRPCPWQQQKTGQQQETDATGENCCNRDISKKKKHFSWRARQGADDNICFLFILFIVGSQPSKQGNSNCDWVWLCVIVLSKASVLPVLCKLLMAHIKTIKTAQLLNV